MYQSQPVTLAKRLMNAQAAGTAAINSSIVDMQGSESAEFLALLGAVTGGATFSAKLQGGNASNGSDFVDLPNSTLTFTPASNEVCRIDYHKPIYRYARMVVTPATQNIAFDGIVVRLYNRMLSKYTADATEGGSLLVLGVGP